MDRLFRVSATRLALVGAIRTCVHRLRSWRRDFAFIGLDPRKAFGKIYGGRIWGEPGAGGAGFHSGLGSHDHRVVQPYVEALNEWLDNLPDLETAADLGCGDFAVGAQIAPRFTKYIACDVVPELVEANRRQFAAPNVEFRTLDITSDPLPQADVVFVRQVLQHLSNKQIANFTRSIQGLCRYLVITEHLPAATEFKANRAKLMGPDIRLAGGSGVVLTEAPFSLSVVEGFELLCVPQASGRIVTTVYALAQGEKKRKSQ